MPVSSKTETDSTKNNDQQASSDPGWYKVRSSFPDDRKRILFQSVSETRARRYVQNRFPRGEEAYLEKPDGSFWSYQHERQGEHGTDTEQWQVFDPESWKPPAEAEPPGQSVWADREV